MTTPNDDQAGFGDSSEPPMVNNSQFDQTIGDDGAIPDDVDDGTIVEETMAPLSPPAGSESDGSDATIADESFGDPEVSSGADAADQTLMNPSSSDQSPAESAAPDQTVAPKGAGTGADVDQPGDGTVVLPDAGAAAEGREVHSDATFVDDSIPAAPVSSAGDEEATLMDPSLAEPPSVENDATLADPDLVADDRAEESADATLVQPGNPEPDATLVDPTVNAANADATMVDHSSVPAAGDGDANDGTVLETELNSQPSGRESEFGRTAASGASGEGNWNETKTPGAARRKAAHETADRWEAQQRYSLVNNFARGGLGQIWLASDTRLRRDVAYKEMLPTALKNRNALERFLEEAQITGQLEHPGIVPIYDIGYQANGAPFYSMKLVRGETMEKEIELMHELPAGSPERSLAFRKLLGSFVSVCNAMAFAHDRGVLHRDLKPLNVMLGAFGEALVLDWGLAKVLDIESPETESVAPAASGELSVDGETMMESSDGESQDPTHVTGGSQSAGAESAGVSAGASVGQSQGGKSVLGTHRSVVTDVRSMGSQTMMGSVMGTPSYMPPEQAKGKIDELDARCDIYSLGGILYKLLTNQQPIPRGKVRDVLKKVIDGEIVPPREHDPEIAKPLESICLKAMSKEIGDRYDSALEMAADVEAWLADEAVSCFEDPWTVKAKRWMKRHPKTVTGVSATLTLVLVVGIGAWWLRTQRLNEAQQFVAEKLQGVAQAVADADFDDASSLLKEASGRIEHESALADVQAVLVEREKLLKTQRLEHIRAGIEPQLVEVDALIDSGDFEAARTQLATMTTKLGGETDLSELNGRVAAKAAKVDAAIQLREVIAGTAAKFEAFLVEADQARAYGSLQEMENIDDDAKQAIARITAALDLFALDTDEPFQVDPLHFESELIWTRRYFEQNAVWPLAELQDVVFELLLLRAEMESRVARNAEPDERRLAAGRALSWIARAETINPMSQALLGWKATWLAQAGDSDQSEVVLAQARKTQASTALDFYMLAEIDRKRGFFDRALERYLKAQQRDPDNYWIQHFTGLCYLNQGEVRAALASFSNCISLRPDYAWPYMLRALCYGHLSKTDEAMADFAEALTRDPEFSGVFVNRGAVLLAQGKFDAAAEDFTAAAKLTPLSAKPLINLALVHYIKAEAISTGAEDGPFADLQAVERQELEQQELTAALAALTSASAAARAPFHPGIHQLRAKILDRQRNTTGALASFLEHIRLELKPERKAESYKLMGYIHFRDGNQPGFQKSNAAFQDAAGLVADDPETTGMIAETFLQLRDFAAARREFEKYIDLVNAEFRNHVKSPDVLLTGMATALEGLGEKREAVQYYTLSLLLNQQVTPLTRRAWALLSYGVPIAIQDFQAARSFEDDIGTSNPDTLIGLAFAWTQAGGLDKSILDTLKTDEGQDTPVPLDRAEKILQAAIEPTRGQVDQLAQQGDIGNACGLLFNTATAYAQCVRLLDETGGDAGRRETLVKTACLRLVACLNLAAREPSRRALPFFIGQMRTDASLTPLYGEDGFDLIFKQLKLEPPGGGVAAEADDSM